VLDIFHNSDMMRMIRCAHESMTKHSDFLAANFIDLRLDFRFKSNGDTISTKYNFREKQWSWTDTTVVILYDENVLDHLNKICGGIKKNWR
jgi:hypothetical protein